MKLHVSLLLLCVFLLSASCEDEVLKPRGPRPVEAGFKADKCATEKDWPICTDDEWGRKCPSGCRIQGLLDQTDHEILGKIEKIRKLLDEGKKLHRSTDLESKNTYNYLRERLVSNAGNDNRYASLAEQLRQRIVELKIKIDRQLRVLDAVKVQIKNQFLAVQRLEVDIDMKLRSCKGSCASYVDFSVEKEGFEALEKQLDRLDTLQVQSVETVSSLKVLKSRPLKDVDVPSIYKSSTTGTERAAQRRTFFTDLDQMQLSLEAEGSTAETAATVSKVSTVCESLGFQKRHNPYTRQQCGVKTHRLCSDEDQEVKCPSGCRLQAFFNETDRDVHQHLSNICEKIQQYNAASSSIMMKTAEFYKAQRRIIVQTYMKELRYTEAAEMLHKNLTVVQEKSTRFSRELQKILTQTEDQMNEIHQLEVDIDIKLRACRGSCTHTFDRASDHVTFGSMQERMSTFLSSVSMKPTSFSLDKKLKLQPVTRPRVSLGYRTLPFIHTNLLTKFEDIEQNRLVMELRADAWNSAGESKSRRRSV